MNNAEITFYAPLFKAAAAHNPGFTFDFQSRSFVLAPAQKFAVSLPEFEVKYSFIGDWPTVGYLGLTALDFEEYLQKHQKNLWDGLCLGYWFDEKSRAAYLDISVLVDSYDRAATIAVRGDQLSFYDFSRAEVTYVRDAATREILPAFQKYRPTPATTVIGPKPGEPVFAQMVCPTGERPYRDAWTRAVQISPRGA